MLVTRFFIWIVFSRTTILKCLTCVGVLVLVLVLRFEMITESSRRIRGGLGDGVVMEEVWRLL